MIFDVHVCHERCDVRLESVLLMRDLLVVRIRKISVVVIFVLSSLSKHLMMAFFNFFRSSGVVNYGKE